MSRHFLFQSLLLRDMSRETLKSSFLLLLKILCCIVEYLLIHVSWIWSLPLAADLSRWVARHLCTLSVVLYIAWTDKIFFETTPKGVALNAESVEDENPVPVGDNLCLKDFKNPSPVVKIAQLTSASSNFGASGDAMVNPNLQNSFLRKLVYGVLKIAKKELRRTDWAAT